MLVTTTSRHRIRKGISTAAPENTRVVSDNDFFSRSLSFRTLTAIQHWPAWYQSYRLSHAGMLLQRRPRRFSRRRDSARRVSYARRPAGTAEQRSTPQPRVHGRWSLVKHGHVLGVLNAPANIIRQNWDSKEMVERPSRNPESAKYADRRNIRRSAPAVLYRSAPTSVPALLILAGIRVERRNYGNRAASNALSASIIMICFISHSLMGAGCD